MLTNEYHKLFDQLITFIPTERLLTNPLKTLAWGTDASFYRLIPKLVIIAHNEDEVSKILRLTFSMKIPVTFRAAGTSLSGQAISDSVLLVASDNWKKHEIINDGLRIRLQPGIVGARANILLAPYRRKIGPDPASINACMIGGIAANNASGMCCGTAENSYKTLHSLKLILNDGTILDTADPQSRDDFQKSHYGMLESLIKLREKVISNSALAERISHKFKMKNTTGYSINALVDFFDPFDILAHLIIGSEGTLAFISEITYHTVPELPHKASALMIFPDIETACIATTILKKEPVSAVEIIDRAGLRSVENNTGMPDWLKELPNTSAALLVETRSADKEKLLHQIEKIKLGLLGIDTIKPIEFTDVVPEYTRLWNIRKGLFPSVGAMRKTGTTCIIEDVAFPLPVLASATLDLQKLFKKYKYTEAVIFGHALEGNLHFVFNQDFGTQQEVDRYASFMDELVEMVVKKYDGSLKAEHGTGRNMAPFVEKEWGSQAFDIMKEVKQIFDPEYLMNPGVILNPNPKAHVSNLKPLAPVHEIVDKCIECGFCETVCVSSDLTLSPRQRIVVLRERERLKTTGHQPHILASLHRDFDYEADQTCATDGLCAINCPVNIDTGRMVKVIRSINHTSLQKKVAKFLAAHTSLVVTTMSMALNTVSKIHKLLGDNTMLRVATSTRKISGYRLPQWTKYLPGGGKKIRSSIINENNPLKVVYFPSCINRAMGTSADYNENIPLTDKIPSLLQKAGYEIIYPKNLKNLCCGMAYSSKGFTDTGRKKSDELQQALWEAGEQGKYPVLCDMSPCLFTMKTNMEPELKLHEPVGFILEYLSEKLEFEPIEENISVFAVCSARKMNLEPSLIKLAYMCSKKVTVIDANCCGFAGDRGFTVPELNTHGLRNLKQQTENSTSGYSTSRTCEIGLSIHSGISFQSIIYLVDSVTKAKKKFPANMEKR